MEVSRGSTVAAERQLANASAGQSTRMISMQSSADGGSIPPMVTVTLPFRESKLLRDWEEKTPGSKALHERATAVLPNGVTHVGRYLEPYPVYVERAAGS